ncbi:hypothetical protein N7462_008213 [Penicillium macrosclerotiorum]|uniref:uncharacterized protein n=1 Tax=Penicillium macrosclerotiorum TaxID=303699 RepID=UPI0025473EC7|nr:uncharacterized protein N7462_008213 [Penicillium macrosclerotiorum]KAJ5679969.1 hypothetical protein N7462_008213 [Penicillium macrosclerotiorum]
MGIFSVLLLAAASFVRASVTIVDPSNYADLAADASDNALLADYTTDNGGVQYLIYDITGPYYYYDTDASLEHRTVSVDKNDTSVVVATDGSQLNISYVTVIKEGYSTWLNQASFFGVNAAVNIANDSTAYISHTNITVHNGAANIYAYGTGSTVYVEDVDLYSSGPVSHGIYAAGNGTVYANNIRHYSGGNRCSSFSGDSPGGNLYITDAVAHTAGIGSAIFYTLGETYGTDIVGKAENAPCLFSDGEQLSVFKNVDFSCGLLAGTILFSSSSRDSGASVSFENSRLTTTGEDMAALWFGNIIASAEIISTEINTASGILVIANTSQVTQAFSYFAGSEENSAIKPADVTVTVSESTLEGNIVAYNGSSITWKLADYSDWTGAAVLGGSSGTATFSISVDATSTWTLTDDVHLQAFKNGDKTLSNIKSKGHNIYYNPANTHNSWLKKKTVSLSGGGKLRPSS